jgi:hypothetical protein
MDDQLRVALNNLRPSDWDRFQDFASAFLLSDFPSLRPIGGTNDKGRDAVLFAPDPDQPAKVVFQYSLVEDWRGKVRGTLKRLQEKSIPCAVLIYATSRDIGSQSDALESELRNEGIALSIRDREWWVVRAGRDQQTRHAAKQLKDQVLGRILGRTRDDPGDGDLTLRQVETGLFYLELQLRDADNDRDLTRVAFEAFVLASLVGTDATDRKTEADIVADVAAEFPTEQAERVRGLTVAALRRLKSARRVTVSLTESTYALHYTERQRLETLAAQRITEGEALDRDLAEHLSVAAETLDYPEAGLETHLLVNVLRRLFEEIALEYGNAFAEAVLQDSVDIPRTDVYDVVERMLINDARTLSMLKMKQIDTFNLLAEAATQTLLSPSAAVVPYFHSLSEAYTVRAFLRATPDVQEAVDKLFSGGELVLDTTVVLPVFVETLLPETQQQYTNLLRNARSSGTRLLCTQGVFNEAATHLRRSLRCTELGTKWVGAVPMVLDRWRALHSGDGDFRQFVSDFLGSDPEADVEDFLTHTLGIERAGFTEEVEEVFDLTTRSRLTELWRERKSSRPDVDLDVLLRHDVEMYLGVLARRNRQPATVAGFETWWVTLETSALALSRLMREEGITLKSGPVMHPNYLSHLLAIGPARRQLTRDQRTRLPFLITEAASPWGIPELQEVATKVRQEYKDRPEYFKRRKLRERMNELKAGRSPLAEGEIAFFG